MYDIMHWLRRSVFFPAGVIPFNNRFTFFGSTGWDGLDLDWVRFGSVPFDLGCSRVFFFAGFLFYLFVFFDFCLSCPRVAGVSIFC